MMTFIVVAIDFHSIVLEVNGYHQLFEYQPLSSFVFSRRKKLIRVWNTLRVSSLNDDRIVG